MRECLVTKRPFTPQNEEHYFADQEAFKRFVESQDPMDEFVPQKRAINWGPFERRCAHCGSDYTTSHPAQMYCDTCTPEEKEAVDRKSPLEYYQQQQPKVKACKRCGTLYEARLPSMRYCAGCSSTGGKIVEQVDA